jgi:hypothetical protein
MLNHQNLLNHKVKINRITKLNLKMMNINNKKKIFYLTESSKLQIKKNASILFKSLFTKSSKNK